MSLQTRRTPAFPVTKGGHYRRNNLYLDKSRLVATRYNRLIGHEFKLVALDVEFVTLEVTLRPDGPVKFSVGEKIQILRGFFISHYFSPISIF